MSGVAHSSMNWEQYTTITQTDLQFQIQTEHKEYCHHLVVMCYTDMKFGLVTGFTEHSQFLITIHYGTITNTQT
jgi:hypothetical protein